MAGSSKLGEQKTPEEIGEMLDGLGKLIDRTKVMYEQYFMGIQRTAPSQLHRDVERRIREVTQMQIRNTGLRFRFATLTQKFGSYNTYWKRTMRKIERGEYVRDVARAGRRAKQRGVEMPDEVLAKLPARMRDRIVRDRKRMAKKEEREAPAQAGPEASPSKVKSASDGAHKLSIDDDLDLDSIFASLTSEEPTQAPPPPNPAAEEFAERPGSYSKSRVAEAREPAPRPVPPLPQRPPTRGGKPPPRPKRPPPTSKPRQAGAPAKPASAPPPGMSERESRVLFEKYSKARRLVGDKRPVSYDQLMNKLGRQAPKIMRDHNATGIDFNVVIKGDKVVLKAKPKKGT